MTKKTKGMTLRFKRRLIAAFKASIRDKGIFDVHFDLADDLDDEELERLSNTDDATLDDIRTMFTNDLGPNVGDTVAMHLNKARAYAKEVETDA